MRKFLMVTLVALVFSAPSEGSPEPENMMQGE